MPTTLTQQNLTEANSLLTAGNINGFYQYFSDRGYKYPTLAQGVLNADTLSGAAAIAYLKQSAAASGNPLTDAALAQIKFDMAQGYLKALDTQIKDPLNLSGTITADLGADATWAFHTAAFEKNGLNANAWTLDTPFQMLTATGREQYWQSILSTPPVVSAQFWTGDRTVAGMWFFSQFSADPNVKAQAQTWLDKMSTSYGALGILTNIDPVAFFKHFDVNSELVYIFSGAVQSTSNTVIQSGAYTTTDYGNGITQKTLTNPAPNTVYGFDKIWTSIGANGDKTVVQSDSISGATQIETFAGGVRTNHTFIEVGTGGLETVYNISANGISNTYQQLTANSQSLADIALARNMSVAELLAMNPHIANANVALNGVSVMVNLNPSTPSVSPSITSFINSDNAMNQLFGAGVISANFYNDYSANSTSWLLNTAPTQQIIPFVPGYNPADPYGFGLNLAPIGAFYETVTPALDLAPSIADKTPVLLDANNQGMSVAALTSRDSNLDGQLTGAELTGLNTWIDANENGQLETGELRSLTTAGISQIKSADYGFYTQGNAVIGTGVAAEPLRPNETSGVPAAIAAQAMPVQPLSLNFIQAVPASNYRTLRDTGNDWLLEFTGKRQAANDDVWRMAA